ncbi:MAG: hypothetical protein Q8L88_14790 [Bacteroidota bacterium]|nr:hypothetical protein [Bacteroidota bacterium]
MPFITDISNADRASIIETIKQIKKKHLLHNRWINLSNRYRKDTLNFIDIDRPNRIKQKQLREYIASSSILFCSDGWINFSRSIESLLNGDVANAIHLAYYAEIKAVMSILASEGIGVFNSRHYYVDNTKRVLEISEKCKTHDFIPRAIIEWGNLPKSESLFKSLSYNALPFSRWFDASPYNIIASPQIIATAWIKEYSIDLSYISEDHVLRNEMSYRPHEFSIDFNVNIFQPALAFVKELWKIIEPDGTNSFSILDRHLLRLAIEKLYISQTTPKRRLSPTAYDDFVTAIFSNLGISTSSYLFQFITRKVEKNDLDLFEYAKKRPLRNRMVNINGNNKKHFYRKNNFYELEDLYGIISRTFILMRLSLSSASTILKSSTISINDLAFWLNNLGTSFGVDINLPGTNMADLFVSVKDSLDNIDTIDSMIASPTLHDAHQNSISDEFKILNQFQRAFFWGISS